MTTWTAKVAGVRPIVVARSRRHRFERATVDLALTRVRSLSSASSEYLAFNESCAREPFSGLVFTGLAIVRRSSCRVRFNTRGARDGQRVAPAGGASHLESHIHTSDIPMTILTDIPLDQSLYPNRATGRARCTDFGRARPRVDLAKEP